MKHLNLGDVTHYRWWNFLNTAYRTAGFAKGGVDHSKCRAL